MEKNDNSEQYSYYSEDTQEIPIKKNDKKKPEVKQINNVQQFKQFQKDTIEKKNEEKTLAKQPVVQPQPQKKVTPNFADGKSFFQDKTKLLQVAIIIICILVLIVVILILVIYFIKKGSKKPKKPKDPRGIPMIEKENAELSEKIQEMQQQYQDELQSDLKDINLDELTQENLEKLSESQKTEQPQPQEKTSNEKATHEKATPITHEKKVTFKQPEAEVINEPQPQLTPDQVQHMQVAQNISNNILHNQQSQKEDVIAKLQNQILQTNKISTQDENKMKAANLENKLNEYINIAASQQIKNEQAQQIAAYQQQYQQQHQAELQAAQEQQEENDFMNNVQ